LLHERGYTIRGARAVLRGERHGRAETTADGEDLDKFFKKMHAELMALQKMIAGRKTDDLFAE
jgi:hypothetical protein